MNEPKTSPWSWLYLGALVPLGLPAGRFLVWYRERSAEVGEIHFDTLPELFYTPVVLAALVVPSLLVALLVFPLTRGKRRNTGVFEGATAIVAFSLWVLQAISVFFLGMKGNVLLDRSEERRVEATVTRISREKTSKGAGYQVWEVAGDFGKRASLRMQAPKLPPGPPVLVGSRVEVRYREGYLGYPWGTVKRVGSVDPAR